MGKEEWERKPFFIGHETIAVLDIYEPHERDLITFWKHSMEEDYITDEQWEAKQVDFKKGAKELINNMHGRYCTLFLNDLMITCAENIMEDWKGRSEERVQEYKKSLVEDIKKIVKRY